MVVYREHPKESRKKFPELVNKVSKVIRYKINTEKSIDFLHPSNKNMGTKINYPIPFIVTQNKNKNLGINLRTRTRPVC